MTPSDTTALRVAVIGIGQPLCGDDGVGSTVMHRLSQLVDGREAFLILDAGNAPENVLGRIISHHPHLVLFIDAADVGESPGTVCWLEAAAAEGFGGSTHSLPLSMLADYVRSETGARVYVLGIQPAQMTFGRPLTPVVAGAGVAVADFLASVLAATQRRSEATASLANTAGGVLVVST